MDEDELLGVFGLDSSLGLSRSDIELISPMLVQQVAQGCGHDDHIVGEDKPSAAAGETLKKHTLKGGDCFFFGRAVLDILATLAATFCLIFQLLLTLGL